MKTLLNRLYGDYLMPSRLNQYDALVHAACDLGYDQLSLREFLCPPPPEGRGLTMVHRHDIDSDLRTAAKMFAIEVRHGITASYYFRLSTLDFGLMREIEAYGSEGKLPLRGSGRFRQAPSYPRRRRAAQPLSRHPRAVPPQPGTDRARAQAQADHGRQPWRLRQPAPGRHQQ
ncbi:hypothetical protein LP420_03160 [Massilia sp. B-10]|nr:hypothetical protein LP420_03160 [Massilia sp. B-10]